MLVQYFGIEFNPNSNDYTAIASQDINNIMDDADILNAVEYQYYEIGKEELPDGLEDITGNIHDEPERVYGFIANGEACYFGLSEVFED